MSGHCCVGIMKMSGHCCVGIMKMSGHCYFWSSGKYLVDTGILFRIKHDIELIWNNPKCDNSYRHFVKQSVTQVIIVDRIIYLSQPVHISTITLPGLTPQLHVQENKITCYTNFHSSVLFKK